MHIGLSPLQSGNNFEATIQDCERAEALGSTPCGLVSTTITRCSTLRHSSGWPLSPAGRGACVWGQESSYCRCITLLLWPKRGPWWI